MFEDKGFKIIMETLKTVSKEDFPVASVLEVDGVFFKAFSNEVYLKKNHLNHAEILAINDALQALKIMDFKGKKATLYSSLEPCCMCLSFASLVRVSKIIFYAYDKKFGGTGRIYTQNSSFTKPEILCIEKEEVKFLMYNFFITIS